MRELKFEWDRNKASSNLSKHGVSFDEAKTVFFDDNARIISDPEHSEFEERFVILGLSSTPRMLVVCHCYRSEDSIISDIRTQSNSKRI